MSVSKCRSCGNASHIGKTCAQAMDASNIDGDPASNTISASNGIASNKCSEKTPIRGSTASGRSSTKDSGGTSRDAVRVQMSPATASSASGTAPDAGNRKQRWDRESYNAYQRDYMRKRRASA